MIENFEDQYISDTYGLVVQYESGSFYDGFGNFIQTTGSGGSTINTGSFATTGSNTFIGNQTISGSSVSGALSIDCLTPATSYGSLTIKSTTNANNNAVLSLVSTASGPNYYVTGSSIDLWGFQSDESPFINGIYKNSFIQDLNYGLNFGSQGSFKWNAFGSAYTGSTTAVDGFGNLTGNPIGTNLLTLNSSNLSSSVPIVGPSLTLGSGGNLTMGTNGVLIAPTVFNTKTATYTLQSSDIGKTIEMNSGSANNLIIPLNLSTTIGFSVDVIQLGPGQTSVSASAGVTIRSAGGRTKLTTQYSAASLTQRALNEYYLVGDLTA
jgi:hypothetical protein